MGSDERTVTVKLGKVADEYERVHFIGHALYSPGLKREDLLGQAGAIADRICEETGYIAFVRDIRIKHFAPFMTDVDFVIDAPSESPVAGWIIVAIIIAIAAIVVVAFLWWTVWVEKVKKYVCEQCADYPEFDGWLAYMGHLKAVHPDKYEGAMDAGANDWWKKLLEPKAIMGILLLVLAISVVPKVIPERRG